MVGPVLPSLDADLRADLVSLEAQDRIRSCPAASGLSRTAPTIDAQPLLSFCSNDYLGLSGHPALLPRPLLPLHVPDLALARPA